MKNWKFVLDFDANPDATPEQIRQRLSEYRSMSLDGNVVTVGVFEEAFDLRMRLDENIQSFERA
jgi:hypothetical protein